MKPEEIKKIREDLVLTQKELAALLNVSIHAVRKWEQGKRAPGGSSVKLMESMKIKKHTKE